MAGVSDERETSPSVVLFGAVMSFGDVNMDCQIENGIKVGTCKDKRWIKRSRGRIRCVNYQTNKGLL